MLFQYLGSIIGSRDKKLEFLMLLKQDIEKTNFILKGLKGSHFICFNIFHFRFNLDMPIYVNMGRDPVERVISWYYYVRSPWYFVERKRAFPDLPLPNPNWLKKVRINKYRLSNKKKQFLFHFILSVISISLNIGYMDDIQYPSTQQIPFKNATENYTT